MPLQLAICLLMLAPMASLGIKAPVSSLEAPGPRGGRGGATHLISFRSCSEDPLAPCNKKFFKQLRWLSTAAAQIPRITHHHLFQGLPAAIEHDPRWAKHLEEGVRGRGFWFWKPALVNLLWSEGTLRDGDSVIWADPDNRTFLGQDPGDAQRWEAVLEEPLWDIFVKEQKDCELAWTKGDIFRHFGVPWSDPHYGLTMQAKAQFLVAWLNPRTRTFMRHWEDLMADFHLASDERSVAPNSPFFRQNRHDQSLLSMLLKANAPDMPAECLDCRLIMEHSPELRSNSSVPWRRHEVYGIPGLSAKVGDFQKEAQVAKTTASRIPHSVVPPVRRICIRGVCSDLDALQPEAVPPGVDSSEE